MTERTESVFISDKLNELYNENQEFRHAIRDIISAFNVPERVVNGMLLRAGYRGNNRIEKGAYMAKLIDVDQNGNDYTLMFSFNDSKYLYYRLPMAEVRVKQLEKLFQQKENAFAVEVDYDLLPNGKEHSVIRKVEGLSI
jgi:hypothetical protein